MKTEQIIKAYEMAKERYAALGINTDKAIEILEKTPISLHCWQAARHDRRRTARQCTDTQRTGTTRRRTINK